MTHKEEEIEEKEDWLNEHAEPDFKYDNPLLSGPEALEKLRSIAGDLDVEFDDDTPPEELVGRIRSAVD